MTALEAAEEPQEARSLWVRLVFGIAAFLLLLIAVSWAARDTLEWMSHAFVDRFGIGGIVAGVLITDGLPLGLTHEPLLVFAYEGGIPLSTVFLVACATSVACGAVGWGLGKLLGRAAWVQNLLERTGAQNLMDKHGVGAVAIAAVTPFPYAVATWAAGATGVRLSGVMWSALLRIPRIAFYLGLIVFGLELSQG